MESRNRAGNLDVRPCVWSPLDLVLEGKRGWGPIRVIHYPMRILQILRTHAYPLDITAQTGELNRQRRRRSKSAFGSQICGFLLLICCSWPTAHSQRLPGGEPPAGSATEIPIPSVIPNPNLANPAPSFPVPLELQDFFENLLKESLPQTYHEEEGWGGTKEVFDGWDLDTGNGKIKTKRKRKTVNHGTWEKYSLEFIDRENQLDVQIYPLTRSLDASLQWGFLITARVRVDLRLQEWWRGVRLYSTSWEGEASIKMAWSGRVTSQLEKGHFPPDMVLKPTVDLVQLEIDDFDLDRVSHADGPVVKTLGEAFEGIVRDIARDQGTKIAEKSNAWIAKHPEKLRISLHDAIQDTWKEIFAKPDASEREQP